MPTIALRPSASKALLIFACVQPPFWLKSMGRICAHPLASKRQWRAGVVGPERHRCEEGVLRWQDLLQGLLQFMWRCSSLLHRVHLDVARKFTTLCQVGFGMVFDSLRCSWQTAPLSTRVPQAVVPPVLVVRFTRSLSFMFAVQHPLRPARSSPWGPRSVSMHNVQLVAFACPFP